MDSRTYALLQRLYKAYSDSVAISQKTRRAHSTALLLASLDVKANKRHRWLRSAAFSSDDIDKIALGDLVESGLAIEIDEPGKFAITLKGVWTVENTEGRLSIDQLMSYLDTKYLDFFERPGPLSDKYRVVILSLIAVRAFSIDSPIDMYASDASKAAFARVLKEAVDVLSSLGQLRGLTSAKLFRTKSNEDVLTDFLRHTDDLGQKTRSLFRVSNPVRYYLNLYERRSLSMRDLAFLFERVLDARISAAQADSLATWCESKAFGEGLEIFDQSKHIFGAAEFGDRVRAALRSAVVGSGR
jgi:hypothetical protein